MLRSITHSYNRAHFASTLQTTRHMLGESHVQSSKRHTFPRSPKDITNAQTTSMQLVSPSAILTGSFLNTTIVQWSINRPDIVYVHPRQNRCDIPSDQDKRKRTEAGGSHQPCHLCMWVIKQRRATQNAETTTSTTFTHTQKPFDMLEFRHNQKRASRDGRAAKSCLLTPQSAGRPSSKGLGASTERKVAMHDHVFTYSVKH